VREGNHEPRRPHSVFTQVRWVSIPQRAPQLNCSTTACAGAGEACAGAPPLTPGTGPSRRRGRAAGPRNAPVDGRSCRSHAGTGRVRGCLVLQACEVARIRPKTPDIRTTAPPSGNPERRSRTPARRRETPGTAPRDPGSSARGTRTPPPEREKREPRPRNVRTAPPAQELTPRTRKTRGPPQVRTPRSVVAASPSGKRPTSVSCLHRRSHLHRPRRRTTRLRRTSCRRRRSFPRGGCRRRTNRSLPRPTSCRCCRCRDAFRWTPPPRGRPSAPDGVNRPCGRETPEPPRRGPRSPPG
jgi:hypothetical protein